MITALHIKVSRDEETGVVTDEVRYVKMERGLANMQYAVDGLIDVTNCGSHDLWYNDEFALRRDPVPNVIATQFSTEAVYREGIGQWSVMIGGDCLITGNPDAEGNATSVDIQTIADFGEFLVRIGWTLEEVNALIAEPVALRDEGK